jgi:hypothetical protein
MDGVRRQAAGCRGTDFTRPSADCTGLRRARRCAAIRARDHCAGRCTVGSADFGGRNRTGHHLSDSLFRQRRLTRSRLETMATAPTSDTGHPAIARIRSCFEAPASCRVVRLATPGGERQWKVAACLVGR